MSSNVGISNLTHNEHPAGRFIEEGLRAAVNADDDTVLGTDIMNTQARPTQTALYDAFGAFDPSFSRRDALREEWWLLQPVSPRLRALAARHADGPAPRRLRSATPRRCARARRDGVLPAQQSHR